MKRGLVRRLVVGGALLCWPLGAMRAAAPAALFADDVVAKGAGFEIRRSQWDDAVGAVKAAAAAQGQSIPQSQWPDLARRTLDRLILNRILLQQATADEKATAKEAADKLIEATRRQAQTDEAYRRHLLAVGLTPEQFQQRVLEQATVERVLDREIKAKINITTDQAREFYEHGLDGPAKALQTTVARLAQTDTNSVFYTNAKQKLENLQKANLAKLDRPETVRVSHILLYTVDRVTRQPLPEATQKTKHELAEKLVTRLKGGEDIGTLAKEFSEDPEVQRTGGEYTVAREGAMAPELKTALFALPTNQVSDLITTPYGYHVAVVHEHLPAGKPPFEKLEPQIKEYLANQAAQDQVPAFLDRVKKEYHVEVTATQP